MTNANWADEVTHKALTITPADGSNRDRACTNSSSDSAVTARTHWRASTQPGSGTCNNQRPVASVSTCSRSIA
ncbi:hypothetical protein DE4576_05483 [Mycobacterium marinum]|nr:hypothetical protein DE4576_05483 [Mycobacterium marinum]